MEEKSVTSKASSLGFTLKHIFKSWYKRSHRAAAGLPEEWSTRCAHSGDGRILQAVGAEEGTAGPTAASSY